MKKIITYGTFDLFHFGHIELLQGAKALGDYLIVALSTDEFNKLKGKKSFFNYKQRKEILESLKYVDEIIPEENWEQKANDIKKYNIDIVVMGSDWEGNPRFEALKKYCEVKYIPRREPFLISSTMLKDHISKQTSQNHIYK